MSFLDNIMKKVGAFLATNYGQVVSGEYAGCRIAFGCPPKTKMKSPYDYSQIIFLKDNEEMARLNIGTDLINVEFVEVIQFPATGRDGYRCKLTYGDGETCEADLFPSKVRAIYMVLRFVMLEKTKEFFEKEVEKLPQA